MKHSEAGWSGVNRSEMKLSQVNGAVRPGTEGPVGFGIIRQRLRKAGQQVFLE